MRHMPFVFVDGVAYLLAFEMTTYWMGAQQRDCAHQKCN